MKIDLHIHSTASDGSFTPAEIVSLASTLNLKAIAITDHDSVEGAKAAMQLPSPAPLNLLAGVEISTSFPDTFTCGGSLHLLGYDMDVDDPTLNQLLLTLRQAREKRTPKIIRRLNALGHDITLPELFSRFKKGQVGRPHIAQLMMEKGFVNSIDEAFDNFLGKNGPAYVDKHRIDCEQAIKTVINAGGISVLAHPGLIKLPPNKTLEELITALKKAGLNGIEAYYPNHTKGETTDYLNIAKQFDLLVTGGTDFHGTIKPEIQMGTGTGEFFVPHVLYDIIKKHKPV